MEVAGEKHIPTAVKIRPHDLIHTILLVASGTEQGISLLISVEKEKFFNLRLYPS
ncbi:hypothetical protein HY640_02540 [Candidatus Woesearchaeota archaeon]|nr:hypothetical protein [Candidatus Woesearchaeota archaeon]